MTEKNSVLPAHEKDSIIRVSGITKKFENLVAVDGISFDVREGELFGFLGPNGAGKTTTINMLTGLARLDSGSIQIAGIDCGRNPKAAQHLIGIVPDESNLYPELSGFDNLCFCGALYGLKKKERTERAWKLLKVVKLEEAALRKFGGYSKGMKRKLTIAAGIIHRPRILFLDEPTSGIDVASVRQIRDTITELKNDGTTIFLTTHYIEEAERLCERIAFIARGKIVKIDSVSNLLKPVQGKNKLIFVLSGSSGQLAQTLKREYPGIVQQIVSDRRIILDPSRMESLGEIVKFIEGQGLEVLEVYRQAPSLEEVFVKITGIEPDLMKNGKGEKV